jgi:hypothetical protein
LLHAAASSVAPLCASTAGIHRIVSSVKAIVAAVNRQ